MRKLLIISLLLTGCAALEIELPDQRSVVVIEGWITDENKQHQVKLSRTVAFQSPEPETLITDAQVWIENQLGEKEFLTYSSIGYYQTPTIQGVAGNDYRLWVVLDGSDSIVSTFERLNPVPVIESISFDSFIRQDPVTGEDVDVYFPIVLSRDPGAEVNFYRYKGYRNGEFLKSPEELELVSDQFINGQALNHNISRFEYELGDEITVELHSLSNEAYNFLQLLKQQTTSLGSSSGTSPASLEGNLTYLHDDDLVLGYFGASAVSENSRIIE